MAYTRVNWNSTTTYVSAENLNVMDKGIKDLDTSVGDVTSLETTNKTVVPAINELRTGLNTVNNNLSALSQSINSVTINTEKVDSYGWSYYTKIGKLIVLYVSFAPKSALQANDVIATLPFETANTLGNIAITGNNGNLFLAGLSGTSLVAQSGTTIAASEKVHATISYIAK